MGAGYQAVLLLPARESERLGVTPVYEAIRTDKLGVRRAIEAGSPSAEMTEGIDEEHGIRDVYRQRALPKASVTVVRFIRLTFHAVRTKIERGRLRINSLRSPSLRDIPGSLMTTTTAQ
jgi:hypothetical protein